MRFKFIVLLVAGGSVRWELRDMLLFGFWGAWLV